MRVAPALLLLLAACGHAADQPQDLDSLDRELTDANSAGNRRDPAVAQALHDQIMVDPTLSQQSNANAVKPPPNPADGAVLPDAPVPDPVDGKGLTHAPAAAAPCPECKVKAGALTLGALAARQPAPATRHCAERIGYSATWANRLPADLPLYPGAQLSEAAGTDADGCRLRIASFATGAAPAKVIDWYYATASHAGYAAEHKGDGALEVLGGTKGEAAFMVYAARRSGGGATVDLVTNAGR